MPARPAGRLAADVRLAIPLLLLLAAIQCLSAQPAAAASRLDRFLKDLQPSEIFPGADRLDAPQGDPPVAAAYQGDRQLGYVFLNTDFANATGYSGRPIQILLAIDMDGVIAGAKLVEHHEPIVLVGIPERRITAVIAGYVGTDAVALARGDPRDHPVDIVSGATVTVMVIDDSIRRAAVKAARAYGLGGLSPQVVETGPRAVVDMSRSAVEDWHTLLGDGSVRRLRLSVGEINAAFEAGGDPEAASRPEPGAPDDPFIDLHVALVSIPTIGRSLLGEAEDGNLRRDLAEGRHAILIAAAGGYSFKGSSYVRGGIFDRFHIVQGDNTIRFRDRDHKRLRRIAAEGAPDFDEVDLFRIPEEIEFDAGGPWRLELLVQRATGPTRKAYLTFDLGYTPPAHYLRIEAATAPAPDTLAPDVLEGPPLWQTLWRNKAGEVAILVVAIGLLTLVFFFQDWLARRPRLADGFRIGFLAFTLFGIGFYANAQLSVVNVMTFFNALITDFRWDYFLLEPLIFILWCSVAASLLFWGRGAFCGWLCPFGALQELLNRAAKAVKIPQIKVPWGLHERLWPLKYMIFLVLFGFSLYSLALAERMAEIEPFKTAIVLKFVREWPFVLFAVVLLAAGLVIERFYCRYLCPLGAALAIPGRMRMFEWLKRYKECGSPCQRCGNECMVQAIHPQGQINPNECLYCLHCQTVYYDDHKCPVVIQRRLKRERRRALATKDLDAAMAKRTSEPRELADFMPDK